MNENIIPTEDCIYAIFKDVYKNIIQPNMSRTVGSDSLVDYYNSLSDIYNDDLQTKLRKLTSGVVSQSELEEYLSELSEDETVYSIKVTDVDNGIGTILNKFPNIYVSLKIVLKDDTTDASNMFKNCTNLKSIDTSGFTTITNASYMFYGCTGLSTIDTSNFSNVVDASYMFYGCSNLTEANIDNFTNVTNAESMFEGCSKLSSVEE